MINNRIHILNTAIDNYSMETTLNIIETAIESNKQLHHGAVNASKIFAMQDDPILRKSVNESDIINADGQAVIWASRFLGKSLPERVTGIDLMVNLVKMAGKKNYKIYLLGAKEEVVSKLSQIYSKNYGSNLIAGFRNGYFTQEEENKIVQDIAKSGANMLFVAMTSPKKENFLYRHKEALQNVNFIMGVGGSFDVLSGKIKRAPVWMQKLGLEWFYRFLQEPKRLWKRYLIGNTVFLWLVLKEKLSA